MFGYNFVVLVEHFLSICGKRTKSDHKMDIYFLVSPMSNNFTGELVGIQIALEFISDLNGSSSVKDRTIHIFTDCQAAIISAFNSQVPNNKIEIILKGI